MATVGQIRCAVCRADFSSLAQQTVRLPYRGLASATGFVEDFDEIRLRARRDEAIA
jgi:hypothetical protein